MLMDRAREAWKDRGIANKGRSTVFVVSASLSHCHACECRRYCRLRRNQCCCRCCISGEGHGVVAAVVLVGQGIMSVCARMVRRLSAIAILILLVVVLVMTGHGGAESVSTVVVITARAAERSLNESGSSGTRLSVVLCRLH